LFLAFQFVEKRTSNQLGQLAESTIEEQLEENDITYVELPKEPKNETYITGTNRVFSTSDLELLKGQQPQLVSKTKLYSKFDQPIPIKENTSTWLEGFAKANVIEGSSYRFWGYEEQSNVLLFFQQYNGKPIFYNKNAVLFIFLNDKGEMVEYQQSLLEDIEEMKVEEDKTGSFTALKAIENMYKRNELKPGSKVTTVELGYYTLIKDTQVFVPTWHLIIDNKESYFVNAFEGHIIRDVAKWSEES
jgi:regulatory protein YycI of two-component signal transduction system YycFG